MATQSDTARDVATGMRFRGKYLVQQAGYTIGLGALAGTALAGKMPPNFLERTAVLRSEVEKSLEDKTVRTAESRQATDAQNQCRHDAKIRIRQAGRRCLSAMQLGVDLPPELGTLSSPPTVPGMLDQMSKTLSLSRSTPPMDTIGFPCRSTSRRAASCTRPCRRPTARKSGPAPPTCPPRPPRSARRKASSTPCSRSSTTPATSCSPITPPKPASST